ncbi:hypothetical protein TWF694_010243 [Orbilia ellipsospora]|uniref:Something about silencing protein 4 domain-containing protein n=1 Tax=Orbilia ellipsospora TaxID=2528407 RepID=A0AAV9X9M1_9PEZI
MQKDRKTKKSAAASGSDPALASASIFGISASDFAPESSSSRSRTNLRTVAPTHIADDNDPYANPKEHRLFTPKKAYNFGKLRPSGSSSHPESVKRRKIVAKKEGIGAAKFTLRETARSRRRHRKVALRNSEEYKNMTIAEQQRAMEEIDKKIQQEIAASDREAERAWELLQTGKVIETGAVETEEGQSPVELSEEESGAQRLLLQDNTRDVTKRHNKKSSQTAQKRPKHQPHLTSLLTITDIDTDSHFDNIPIEREVSGRSRRPNSKKMSSTPKVRPEDVAKFEEMHKNDVFSPKEVRSIKKKVEQNALLRYNFLRAQAEKEPGYYALTSKNKKIKLQEVEDTVEAELFTTLNLVYTKAEKPPPPGQAAKDAALWTPRSDGVSATIYDKASSSSNAESKSTGAAQQSSAKKRMVETDLPEKTRLHNRSKSSPKKRRLAPLDFEAMDKVNKFNAGETTPSGSETVGDLNPLRRLTRSLTTATSPVPIQGNAQSNHQGDPATASKRSEPGHGTPVAKTKETVATRKRKQPHVAPVEAVETQTPPAKRSTRSQNVQVSPVASVAPTTPSSAGSSVGPQRIIRQLPRRAILAQSIAHQTDGTDIQGNDGGNEEQSDKAGVWEKVLNGDIFKDMLPWVWRGPRPKD